MRHQPRVRVLIQELDDDGTHIQSKQFHLSDTKYNVLGRRAFPLVRESLHLNPLLTVSKDRRR